MTAELRKTLKETYHTGVSVRLNSMEKEPQMPSGLTGRVTLVDDEGQIHVKWSNGSSLALICGVDKFIAFDGPEPGEYLREKLCLCGEAKVWYRENPENHTVAAVKSAGMAKLISRAERYIEKNIAMTQELAVLTCMPYKTESLLDEFVRVHVLSDEDVRELRNKKEYTKDESEEGCCPKCGHDNLEYGSSEIEDNTVHYPWTCKKCKAEGTEFGAIYFDGHYIDWLPPIRKNKKKGIVKE